MVGNKSREQTGKKQHFIKRFLQMRLWQLIVVFLLLIFVSATLLRINNVGMIDRRDAVLSSDKSADSDVTKERLYSLQRYVSDHMNTNTGVIYLQGSFDRAWEKIQKDAEKRNSHVGELNVYKKIEKEVCAPMAKAHGWNWPDPEYISCQRRELAKYPNGQMLINQVDPPNKELFRHSYISPVWSPDFAGFFVMATLLTALLIATRVIGSIVLNIILRFRH